MKICVVNDCFTLSGGGGGQYRVLGIARQLGKMGFDVTLCCPYFTTKSLYDFPEVTPPQGWILNQYANTVKLLRRVGTTEYDALYCQLPCPVTKGLAVYLGKLSKKKIYVDFGDLWYSDETGLVHQRVNDYLVRRICHKAEKVTAATIGLTHRLQQIHETVPIKYVPCGVNLDLFNDRSVVDVGLREQKNRRIILYQGLVSVFTGCHRLAPLARDLIQRGHREVLFVIVGDGPYLEELRRQVIDIGLSDFFRLIGRVPHNMIPSYISASDICFAPFPRRRDIDIGVFPIKVVEYMAMGKAVVASNINSVKQIIAWGDDGLYSPASEFASLISRLLEHPEESIRMGERARRKIAEKYDWKIVVKEMLDFWFD